MKLSNLVLVALAAAFLSACVRGESVGDVRPRNFSPRDAHARDAAQRVKAHEIKAWEDAASRALRSGLTIDPSFRESIRFPDSAPHAVAYRFTLSAGESL